MSIHHTEQKYRKIGQPCQLLVRTLPTPATAPSDHCRENSNVSITLQDRSAKTGLSPLINRATMAL
ncbi:MAG TPA: hypothetical protein DCW33_00390 [Proteobacteria bacterium]|nr:hypothetical protein [Pseudomonadota bacterium]